MRHWIRLLFLLRFFNFFFICDQLQNNGLEQAKRNRFGQKQSELEKRATNNKEFKKAVASMYEKEKGNEKCSNNFQRESEINRFSPPRNTGVLRTTNAAEKWELELWFRCCYPVRGYTVCYWCGEEECVSDFYKYFHRIDIRKSSTYFCLREPQRKMLREDADKPPLPRLIIRMPKNTSVVSNVRHALYTNNDVE